MDKKALGHGLALVLILGVVAVVGVFMAGTNTPTGYVAAKWYECNDPDAQSQFDKNSLLTKSVTTFSGGSKTDKCYTWNQGKPNERTRLIEGTCKQTSQGIKFNYWYADCDVAFGKGAKCVDGVCVKSTEQKTCSDSDGKDNFMVKGITGPDKYGNTYTDQCVIIKGNEVEESDPPLKECSGLNCAVTDAQCEQGLGKNDEFTGYEIAINYQSCNKCVDGACVCSDSDGMDLHKKTTSTGLNFAKTGTISKTDYCSPKEGNNVIYEGYCNADGQIVSKYTKCPADELCNDGACVKSEKQCTDSDDTFYNENDPNNNKVKGITTGLFPKFLLSYEESSNAPEEGLYASKTDYCIEAVETGIAQQTGKLVEYYCAGDSSATVIVTSCQDNHYCSEGACVPCSGASCPQCYDSKVTDNKFEWGYGVVTGLNENGIFVTQSDWCFNNGGKKVSGETFVGPSILKTYSCSNNIVMQKTINCEYGCSSAHCMIQKEAEEWSKQ